MRTDIHRPSAIIPDEYEFVGIEYVGEDDTIRFELSHEREGLQQLIVRNNWKFSTHEHGGSCHVCGANAFYLAIFHHGVSNTLIKTGMDCAQKMQLGDPGIFRNFRKKIAEIRKRKAGIAKACLILDELGIPSDEFMDFRDSGYSMLDTLSSIVGWPIDNRAAQKLLGYSNFKKFEYVQSTLGSMADSLIKYGWSAKQEAFATKLWQQLKEFMSEDFLSSLMESEEKRKQHSPCPEGSIEVTGKVLAVKCDDVYGIYKILVESSEGWRVWGSRPASLREVKIGDIVFFRGTIKRSDKDPSFGFFKRPTRARIA